MKILNFETKMYQLINKHFFRIILLLFCFCNYFVSYSQSIQRYAFVSAAGSNSEFSGYSLQSSIGELAVATKSTFNSTLTQGFIQNEPPGVVVSADQNATINFKAYPNPVSSFFTIELMPEVANDIQIVVFDVMGRKLDLGKDFYSKNDSHMYLLNMSALGPGLYIVKVYSQATKFNKVFKVSKI